MVVSLARAPIIGGDVLGKVFLAVGAGAKRNRRVLLRKWNFPGQGLFESNGGEHGPVEQGAARPNIWVAQRVAYGKRVPRPAPWIFKHAPGRATLSARSPSRPRTGRKRGTRRRLRGIIGYAPVCAIRSANVRVGKRRKAAIGIVPPTQVLQLRPEKTGE